MPLKTYVHNIANICFTVLLLSCAIRYHISADKTQKSRHYPFIFTVIVIYMPATNMSSHSTHPTYLMCVDEACLPMYMPYINLLPSNMWPERLYTDNNSADHADDYDTL